LAIQYGSALESGLQTQILHELKKAKVWAVIADIINENKFDTYPELS
jgi:hypothetical protein